MSRACLNIPSVQCTSWYPGCHAYSSTRKLVFHKFSPKELLFCFLLFTKKTASCLWRLPAKLRTLAPIWYLFSENLILACWIKNWAGVNQWRWLELSQRPSLWRQRCSPMTQAQRSGRGGRTSPSFSLSSCFYWSILLCMQLHRYICTVSTQRP